MAGRAAESTDGILPDQKTGTLENNTPKLHDPASDADGPDTDPSHNCGTQTVARRNRLQMISGMPVPA